MIWPAVGAMTAGWVGPGAPATLWCLPLSVPAQAIPSSLHLRGIEKFVGCAPGRGSERRGRPSGQFSWQRPADQQAGRQQRRDVVGRHERAGVVRRRELGHERREARQGDGEHQPSEGPAAGGVWRGSPGDRERERGCQQHEERAARGDERLEVGNAGVEGHVFAHSCREAERPSSMEVDRREADEQWQQVRSRGPQVIPMAVMAAPQDEAQPDPRERQDRGAHQATEGETAAREAS